MAAAVTVGATPLSAGDLNEALVEVFPAAPVVSVSPIGLDWTGGHGGLSLGMLSAQGRGTSDNGYIYGLHGGYVYDFGTVVVGGEFELLTGNDFDLGGAELDSVMRLKGRVGYEVGQTLLYGTAGGARMAMRLVRRAVSVWSIASTTRCRSVVRPWPTALTMWAGQATMWMPRLSACGQRSGSDPALPTREFPGGFGLSNRDQWGAVLENRWIVRMPARIIVMPSTAGQSSRWPKTTNPMTAINTIPSPDQIA